MFQDVFVLGARGKVGSTLVRQIYDRGDTNADLHSNPTRVVGLVDQDSPHLSVQFNQEGISQRGAEEFIAREGSYPKFGSLNELLDFVASSYRPANGEKMLSFADVTNAREEMGQFHLRTIRETPFGLVTSNKHPLVSCTFDEFKMLTQSPTRYGYRCSVMAGAEAVDMIRDLRDLGDPPTEISGCFSGTLGYLCTELEKGRNLSEIVTEAQEKGYTEPHPADDLDGGDVERKILILARTAGFDIPKERIKREPFIPEEYLVQKDIKKFLASLSELNMPFLEKVHKAKGQGYVLRYVARFDNSDGTPTLNIGLRGVQNDGPIGSLNGTANKIVIRTQTYNQTPYCVQAPGAGLAITAQNVRRDLLAQLLNRVTSFSKK